MDSAVNTAARALAAGDPLGALKWVALREDAPALALRGTAMAQLGEFTRARALLRRAATAFGAEEKAARARCVLAQAEIALAVRDVRAADHELDRAAQVLARRGDAENATFARLIRARRLALLGDGAGAERVLARLEVERTPARLAAVAHLVAADPASGKILKTIESDRFVTGVTWVDGELWHGTQEDDESELRRIEPESGAVLERLAMPRGTMVSGLESAGADLFLCGGGNSRKVRAVRRPRRR